MPVSGTPYSDLAAAQLANIAGDTSNQIGRSIDDTTRSSIIDDIQSGWSAYPRYKQMLKLKQADYHLYHGAALPQHQQFSPRAYPGEGPENDLFSESQWVDERNPSRYVPGSVIPGYSEADRIARILTATPETTSHPDKVYYYGDPNLGTLNRGVYDFEKDRFAVSANRMLGLLGAKTVAPDIQAAAQSTLGHELTHRYRAYQMGTQGMNPMEDATVNKAYANWNNPELQRNAAIGKSLMQQLPEYGNTSPAQAPSAFIKNLEYEGTAAGIMRRLQYEEQMKKINRQRINELMIKAGLSSELMQKIFGVGSESSLQPLQNP